MYVISRNFSKDFTFAILLIFFFSLLKVYTTYNISHLVIMSFRINIFKITKIMFC